MRIGLVTPFNPAAFPDRLGPDVPQLHRGATAVHILAEELLAQGHELTVFTSYPGAGPVREWKDLRTEDGTLPAQGSLRVIAVPRSGSLPLPGKRLAVARRLRKVLALEIGNLDVLHAQWTYDYALAAGAFAKRIPTFCSVRDWAPLQLQMQTAWDGRLYWLQSLYISRKVLKNKHIRFIANSQYTKDCLLQDDPAKEVILLPNPIRKATILQERTWYPEHPVLVSVCQSIDARKNIGTLLEAFRRYRKEQPEAELHLGGNDCVEGHPKLAPWKDLMEGVHLHGWLDRDALNDLLDRASVMVLPSLEETFGNVLLEGMARRVAVVGGRDSGAVPDVLGQGKYGILCDVRDPEDLCRALRSAERREQVDAATAYILREYASDRIAQKQVEIYRSFVAEAPQDDKSLG